MSSSHKAPPSIIRSTLGIMLSDGALIAGTIFTTPYLLRILGKEPYGILGIFSVLTSQLGILQLGIGPAATRIIATHRARNAHQKASAAILAAALIGGIAGVLVGLSFAVVAPWGWRHGFKASPRVVEEALACALPGAVVAGMQTGLTALTGILQGHEDFSALNRARFFQGMARLLVSVSSAALGWGVFGILSLQCCVDLLVGVYLASVCLHRLQPSRTSEVLFEVRRLLRVGIPFAIATILTGLLLDVEKLAISSLLSVEEFTHYNVPYGVISKLIVLSGALSGVLFPRLSSLAITDPHAAAALIRRATRVIVIGMMLVLSPLIVAAPEWLSLWLGRSFADHAQLATRILLVALLVHASVFVSSAFVRGRAHPMTLPILYAVELAIHLVVMRHCVVRWGVAGAALAWGIRVTIDTAMIRLIAWRVIGENVIELGGTLIPTLVLSGLALLGERTSLPLALRALVSILALGAVCPCLVHSEDRACLRDLLRRLTRRA